MRGLSLIVLIRHLKLQFSLLPRMARLFDRIGGGQNAPATRAKYVGSSSMSA